MHRSARLFVILVVSTCFYCGEAQSARIKIPLIREAIVQGGTIRLSDLLPETSPASVRTLAEQIVVGQSPRPGTVRVLSDDAMAKIVNDGNLSDSVEVPGNIVVRRAARLITRDEVTDAIRTTLRRNEMFNGLEVNSDAVRFSASVRISAENADLRVTRVELDRTLHLMKFVLVSGTDPSVLPFMAMAQPTGETSEIAAMLNLPTTTPIVANTMAAAVTRINAPTKIVGSNLPVTPHAEKFAEVEQGKPVQVHLSSASGTQIYLTAIALERGAMGQRIRVKIQPAGKVLNAQVVGHGQLEGQF